MRQRDGSCRVSEFTGGTEAAHLVPERDERWFKRNINRLGQYVADRGALKSPVNDIANRILLRRDIHLLFDERLFVFYPKRGNFVVHFLEHTDDTLGNYHNAPLHPALCAGFFHYPRLAWAVFPLLRQAFLGSPRNLLVRDLNDPNSIPQPTSNLDPEDVLKRGTPPSAASKKRTRTEDLAGGSGRAGLGEDGDGNDVDDGDLGDGKDDDRGTSTEDPEDDRGVTESSASSVGSVDSERLRTFKTLAADWRRRSRPAHYVPIARRKDLETLSRAEFQKLLGLDDQDDYQDLFPRVEASVSGQACEADEVMQCN